MKQEKINTTINQIDVSAPQSAICAAVSPLNLFMAGHGSGKTHVMSLLSADFVVNMPHVVGFIGANTYGQLSKATLKRIFTVWKDLFGWVKDVHYFVDRKPPKSWITHGVELKDYLNTITFDNGCLIILGSLDNYKAIDGTEFGWALLDETKDTKEDAVKEVIIGRLRMRGMWVDKDDNIYLKEEDTFGKDVVGWNPLYIFTSPARVKWLNEWFELDDDYDEITLRCKSKTDYYQKRKGIKYVCISSSWHNSNNLPKGYIESRLEAWAGDEGKIDRLIYGSPVSKTGGEWWTTFDRSKHVKECFYDPTLPLHITLDFNVSPYMTLLVSQLHEVDGRFKHKTFKEYCLPHPMNNTPDICNEFLYDFAHHEMGVFYYGDHSGKNRQTVTKDIKHNYDALEMVLQSMIHNGSDRVLPNNPGLIKQKDFCSRIMNSTVGVDVEVDPSCKNLINDFEYLKESPTGAYIKPKVKDKDTGVTYEKLGHCSDAFRYELTAIFEHIYESFI